LADNGSDNIPGHADGAGGGLDWRDDAAASLARSDPEKARSRGRPKGAKNRKTADFQAWYDEQGFKDPLQLQAEFMSADPVALQAWFAEHERTVKAVGKVNMLAVPSLFDITHEQMMLADKIAPYLHGKAPAQDSQPDERLPMIIINTGTNQLDQAGSIADQRGIRLGFPLPIDTSKNNDLAGDARESLTQKVSRGGKDE
jgi:hypothetical protein